jgi:hypothetical protein
METNRQACLSSGEKTTSSPRPEVCDVVDDDILLDNFFDHSQPLDGNELETLLNTKFNSLDDAVEQSANSVIHWRPAQPENHPQQRSPSRTKMEFSSLHEKYGALKPAQPDHPFTLSQLHSYGPSANVAPTYHNHPLRTTQHDATALRCTAWANADPHMSRSLLSHLKPGRHAYHERWLLHSTPALWVLLAKQRFSSRYC